MGPTRLVLLACVLSLGLASGARADPSPTEEASAAAQEADPIVRDGASRDPLAGSESGTSVEDADELDAMHADEDEGPTTGTSERRPRRTFRWSDGPRRVPTPRGVSMERAEELGLGTRECASRLLHGRPDETWTRAARGRAPDRLLWPIDEGRWVRGFGFVRTTRPDLIHRGVDISAPVGTVVRAAADGIVAYSDNGIRGYGNLVMIVHRNGWMTLYAHNARTTVQPGYRVRRGERIALVGTTGITHGPHVHFELWQNGHAVDPSALFDGGPGYVERIGQRAARRGEVAAPREVTAADRPDEAPLPPHPDEVAEARARASARRRASERRGTIHTSGRSVSRAGETTRDRTHARARDADDGARAQRSTERARRGTTRG
jgi:murein DD-endopeptidase MepM/ murein hydrolase activator NlpD